MSGIDWQHFLTYEVRYQLTGFCGVITLNRFFEDEGGSCLQDSPFFTAHYSTLESYRLVMLIIDGIETKKVKIACNETTGVSEFKQLFNKIERLLLEFEVSHQVGMGIPCGLKENFNSAITDIHRCHLDCYIYPADTVLWLSSICKGRDLLPQSLLYFLAREGGQQALSTAASPPLTPGTGAAKDESQYTAANEGERRRATAKACETVIGTVSGKITEAQFKESVKAAVLNQTGAPSLFQAARFSQFWASEKMIPFKFKRGQHPKQD